MKRGPSLELCVVGGADERRGPSGSQLRPLCAHDFTSHILCCIDCFNLRGWGGGVGAEFLHPLNYHTHMLAHMCFVFTQHTACLLFSGDTLVINPSVFSTDRGFTCKQTRLADVIPLYLLFLFHSFMSQASLNKLMETLGQSEPYFVKCIRSNAEKVKHAAASRSSFHSFDSGTLSESVHHSLLLCCRFSFTPPSFSLPAAFTV